MDPEQDTEITLGTAKLLGLFFGLVIVCAVFFALGYTLGRKSDVALAPPALPPLCKRHPTPQARQLGVSNPLTPMTFYKAVEQKDANPQLTPASLGREFCQSRGSRPTSLFTEQSSPGTSSLGDAGASLHRTANPPDPMAAIPTGGYFVQVAAVSKQEDAEALVDALKKKQYPAFVAASSSADKLFRVQVGPFADIKDAEGMRTRLVNDGYNPILKK